MSDNVRQLVTQVAQLTGDAAPEMLDENAPILQNNAAADFY